MLFISLFSRHHSCALAWHHFCDTLLGIALVLLLGLAFVDTLLGIALVLLHDLAFVLRVLLDNTLR